MITSVRGTCSLALAAPLLLFFSPGKLHAQQALPDAPTPAPLYALQTPAFEPDGQVSSSQSPAQQGDKHGDGPPAPPILQQQKRVFGVLPNYTSVSGGTKPAPAGWRTDSIIAWKQSTDYVGNLYSIATSAIAYGQDTHPSLDTVNGGNAPIWGYVWRGLVDKTSQTAQGSLLFLALLHQDTRYFAMGRGSKVKRTVHAAAAVIVAHSYSGRPVFNVAGLAGKVGAQGTFDNVLPCRIGGLRRAGAEVYLCLSAAGGLHYSARVLTGHCAAPAPPPHPAVACAAWIRATCASRSRRFCRPQRARPFQQARCGWHRREQSCGAFARRCVRR